MRPAGDGTMHPGAGRCHYHDDQFDPAAPSSEDGPAQAMRLLRETLELPNPLDLTGELALARTLVRYASKTWDLSNAKALETLVGLTLDVAQIAKIASGIEDNASKIAARETLTTAERAALVSGMISTLQDFVDEDQLANALATLEERVGVGPEAGQGSPAGAENEDLGATAR